MKDFATIYLHTDALQTSCEATIATVMPWLRYECLDRYGLWDDCFQLRVLNTNCRHRRYYISAAGKLKVLD